jgi:hypothetical protein
MWAEVEKGIFSGGSFRRPRHCERDEAIHSDKERMDCFAASAPRNDEENPERIISVFRRYLRHFGSICGACERAS